MKQDKLSLNWNKGSYLELSLLVLLAWMLLGKIDPASVRNAIIVVGTTREANRIAQLMGKFVISAVERTTLKCCVDPVRDQKENAGQTGPARNAHTDVMYMK